MDHVIIHFCTAVLAAVQTVKPVKCVYIKHTVGNTIITLNKGIYARCTGSGHKNTLNGKA